MVKGNVEIRINIETVREGLAIVNKFKFVGPEESWYKENMLESWKRTKTLSYHLQIY